MEKERAIEIAKEFEIRSLWAPRGYTVRAAGCALIIEEPEGRTSAYVDEDNFWIYGVRIIEEACNRFGV